MVKFYKFLLSLKIKLGNKFLLSLKIKLGSKFLENLDTLLTSLENKNKQCIIQGVGNSTSLKETLIDFGNVVKNSEGQEVELLADAYIVYDRIKDEN